MSAAPRTIPMARLFGVFVVLSLAVLGIVLGLLAANGLNAAFERHLNRLMDARVESHMRLLMRYVNNHARVLADLADTPIVVQGVMQPETGLPNAIEYLDTIQIVGQRPRLMLYDFQGRVLYDTARHETCLPSRHELQTLLGGSQARLIRFETPCPETPAQGEPYLRITVPVTWRDWPEGALSADIPVSQVSVLRELNESSPLESIALVLDGSVIYEPAAPAQGIEELHPLPALGVSLRSTMDVSGVDRERDILLSALALAVLTLVAFFGVLAFFVGRSLFVQPLAELRQRADLVRQGQMPAAVKRVSRVQEISDLDEALQEMAREVLAKHRQLEEQVAEREQVALALRESERLLAATGRTAKVGGWQLDQDTGELAWTAETYAIHEVPPDYVPAVDTALAFYTPESRAVLAAALEKLERHDEPYDLELAFVTAAGRHIWVRTKGECAGDPARPSRITGTIQDITERKTAELALRESEAFNKGIIESSPDCIKVLDEACRLRYMSPGGQKLMCIEDITVFLGMYYPELLPEEARPRAEGALEQARQGRTASFEAYMEDLQCTPHWWSVSVTPLTGPDGSLQRFLVVSRDVSSLKQAEEEHRRAKEQAIAANKAKSEFLANMSHEIRTPMNGILGMAQLLSASPLNQEQRESLQTIETSANALLQLINDILDLSKIEAEKMELQPEPFGLRTLLRETVETLAPQAAHKGLQLSWEVAPDVPDIVLGDPKRLRQICLNLTGNALKFTEQGSVRLEVACEDCLQGGAAPYPCRLRFSVADTGIGIPPEAQELIFESFSQVDGSATRSYGGTGLGLSISRRLVQLMGGEMHLQSTPGQGSTFSFTAEFQVDPELQLQAPPAPAVATFTAWGLLILVVDDNQINRLVARRMLERTGNTVHLAGSGAEALELLQVNDYALVFMDVQMPGMDGLQTTAAIRRAEGLRSSRDIHVVAMTAHAMKGDRERFLEAGMNDYLPKPLSMENLQAALRRFVEASATPPARAPGIQEQTVASALEREEALRRFADDVELYQEAADDYLRSSPGKLEAIEQALRGGDCEEAMLHAHSMKGNSATLGAILCAETAEDLETACRDKAMDRAWSLLATLRQRFSEVAALLQ